MSDSPHRRRSARPLVVGFAVLAVLIAAAGYWAWRQQSRSMQGQAERSLAAIDKLKADQISAWLSERHGNAELIRSNRLISAAVAAVLAGRDVAHASADMQSVLDAYRRIYDYREVVLTSPKGVVLLRSPQAASTPLGAPTIALVRKAAATGQVESSDLYPEAAGPPLMDFIAPILRAGGGAPAIAAVTLRVDPSEFIYPLIQTWPLPSRSGESLLVERRGDQVVYINELRHRKNSAFKLTAPLNSPDLPAAMAVRGRQGVAQGVDYRGISVLAAMRPVPNTPWFIVAKEDTGEVLGPIRTRGWLTAGFTLLLVVLAGAGTLLLWRARESQTAAEVRESEERYRALVEHAPMAIFVNRDDRVLLANEACLRLFGATSPEQLLGKSPFDLFHPDCHPGMRERIHRLRDEGEEVPQIEEKIVRLDGVIVNVEVAAAPFQDQGVNAIHVVLNDITERKRAEAELRESEDKFKYVFDQSVIGKSITLPTGELRVNAAFCRMLGYSSEELATRTWQEVSHPNDIAETEQRIAQLVSGTDDAVRFVKRYIRKDGVVVWGDVATSLRRDASGDPLYFMTAVVDITEQRRANEELRETSERLSLACFAGGVGIWELDVVSDVLICDEQMFQLYGVAPDQFSGTYAAWRAGVHPADRPRSEAELEMAVQRDDQFDSEFRVVWPNGTIRTIRSLARVYRDAGGRATKLIGTDYDITELKRTEEEVRSLNAELEQRVTDRTAQLDAANSELEAFAYSVSHDLRAPLRHISGFSALLAERAGDDLDEKSRHYVDTISRSVREMGVLIDDLLQFSRTGRAELTIEPVDMNATLAEALEPLRRETEDRDIRWSIGPLPAVVADHALLRQVWANLLGNAVKYSRGRAPAHIEVGARDGDTANEDVFWVRDNGVGFDMAYAHKLFGVFQRLHDSSEFEGTGIGLANVQRIVARHGGRVWAEAEVDHGATFSFSLPRRKEPLS